MSWKLEMLISLHSLLHTYSRNDLQKEPKFHKTVNGLSFWTSLQQDSFGWELQAHISLFDLGSVESCYGLESQNHRTSWVGRDLQRLCSPTPLSWAGTATLEVEIATAPQENCSSADRLALTTGLPSGNSFSRPCWRISFLGTSICMQWANWISHGLYLSL